MQTVAYLDLDGVLADFVGGALAVHRERSPNPHVSYGECNWDFFEKQLGLDPFYFWSVLGREFWATLNWHRDGGLILAEVEKHFGSDRIAIVTSPCLTEGCLEGKRQWIRQHIPEYERRLVFCNQKELLAAPHKVLVDDSDRNIELFRAAGGYAIRVPRPWNIGKPDVCSVFHDQMKDEYFRDRFSVEVRDAANLKVL